MRHGELIHENPPNDPNELNSRILEGKKSLIPSDPSQITSIFQSNTTNQQERDLERIYRLIPKLAESLPEYVWPQIIQSVFEKLWSYPRDSVIIQFLSKISLQLSNCSSFVFSKIVLKLKEQGIISQQIFAQKNSFLMENLIFERLAPLLVLKMLTLDSFSLYNKEKEVLVSDLKEILVERYKKFFLFYFILFYYFFK